MKNFGLVLIPLFVCLSFTGCAKDTGSLVDVPKQPPPTFSMQMPEGWIRIDKEGLKANLGKFEFSEETVDQLEKDNSADKLLAAYSKYDPAVTEGIIPTIQVVARPNRTKDFEHFKRSIVSSIDQFRKAFDQFEITEQPAEVDIGGARSLFFVARFVMRRPEGNAYHVRSRMYAVPTGRWFIQFNFTDHPEDEDCTVEFDQVIRTISIAK
jgi:hypothetical protein